MEPVQQAETNPFNPIKPRPLVIVISGPAGVGKDTVIQRMKDRNLPFHFVVTATTRPPRPNEVHGVDYYFVSVAEFEEMIDSDQLIEYAFVYNDYKGIPQKQLRDALASGKDVLLRLDVQGAAKVRDLFPEAVLIFLTVPDGDDLIKRLRSRGADSTDRQQVRAITARQELARISEFDYIVVNRDDRLDETVDDILAIITAEKLRVRREKVGD